MESYVFCPDDTPEINIREIAIHGAKTWSVNGLITDCDIKKIVDIFKKRAIAEGVSKNTVKANATLTFLTLKPGLFFDEAVEKVGDVYLDELGVTKVKIDADMTGPNPFFFK